MNPSPQRLARRPAAMVEPILPIQSVSKAPPNAQSEIQRLAKALPPGPVTASAGCLLLPPGPLACNIDARPFVLAKTMQSDFDADARQGVAPTTALKSEPLPHGVTTLIVRNIPARCTQASLLDLWPPEGVYNLLHLPYDHRRKCHVGKAMINFVSSMAAEAFRAKWQGGLVSPKAKVKKLSMVAADVQGLRGYLDNLLPLWRSGRMKNKIDIPIIIQPDGSFGDFKALMTEIHANSQDLAREHDSGAIFGSNGNN